MRSISLAWENDGPPPSRFAGATRSHACRFKADHVFNPTCRIETTIRDESNMTLKKTDKGFTTPVSKASAQQQTSVLEIDSGPLRGVEQGELLSYLGIPYAAPPVGNLRWMPPQAPTPWNSVLNATKVGNTCAQNAELGVFGKAGGEEDCLYLNVFVSKGARQTNKKLPVFVWIHGGSLWVGSGCCYDASKLALAGNAVVVTFNYRLGLLGFFAHPALDREGHAFGNYGLMDQTFVLDWVQRNIAVFGGDPANVTISGESSGGNSVLYHMVSPWSAGKFQHAIAMSGTALVLKFPTFGCTKPLDQGQKLGSEFAKAVGCSNQDPASLRKLPVKQILAAHGPYLINQPVIDGEFLPMHPGEAFRSGKFNRVTLINGTNLDEGTFFAGFPENESGVPMTAAGYADALKVFFGDLTQDVIKEYPVKDYNSPSEAFAEVCTSFLFACPARAINRWVADKTPTYAYEFADRTAPSYLEPTTFALGASHTYELPYIFPGFHGGAGKPVTLNPLQEQLSNKMVHYWTTAAQAGDREAEWPRYSAAQEIYLRLTLPEPRLTSEIFSKTHKCDFWDKMGIY